MFPQSVRDKFFCSFDGLGASSVADWCSAVGAVQDFQLEAIDGDESLSRSACAPDSGGSVVAQPLRASVYAWRSPMSLLVQAHVQYVECDWPVGAASKVRRGLLGARSACRARALTAVPRLGCAKLRRTLEVHFSVMVVPLIAGALTLVCARCNLHCLSGAAVTSCCAMD